MRPDLRAAWVGLLRVFLATVLIPGASGQSLTPATGGEVWPEVDAHIQLSPHLRALAFAGSQQGVGFPYRQGYLAAGIGYQWKRVSSHYRKNIDPDKEHLLVFGTGFEFLRTARAARTSDSGRLTFDGTSSFHTPAELLVRDRSRIEVRWTSGLYSTTVYRNRASLERDFVVHGFRFNPYGSMEVFYTSAKNSWYQERYSAGIRWSSKRFFALDTFYLRKQCPSCSPESLNVAGMTVNFYFNAKKK